MIPNRVMADAEIDRDRRRARSLHESPQHVALTRGETRDQEFHFGVECFGGALNLLPCLRSMWRRQGIGRQGEEQHAVYAFGVFALLCMEEWAANERAPWAERELGSRSRGVPSVSVIFCTHRGIMTSSMCRLHHPCGLIHWTIRRFGVLQGGIAL